MSRCAPPSPTKRLGFTHKYGKGIAPAHSKQSRLCTSLCPPPPPPRFLDNLTVGIIPILRWTDTCQTKNRQVPSSLVIAVIMGNLTSQNESKQYHQQVNSVVVDWRYFLYNEGTLLCHKNCIARYVSPTNLAIVKKRRWVSPSDPVTKPKHLRSSVDGSAFNFIEQCCFIILYCKVLLNNGLRVSTSKISANSVVIQNW